MLLYSLYGGIDLDDDCAVTGVIMPSLIVKAVGGVPSKVRGAHIQGLKYAVIPEENRETVGDMTLLYELKTIWKNKFPDDERDGLKPNRQNNQKKISADDLIDEALKRSTQRKSISRFSYLSGVMSSIS